MSTGAHREGAVAGPPDSEPDDGPTETDAMPGKVLEAASKLGAVSVEIPEEVGTDKASGMSQLAKDQDKESPVSSEPSKPGASPTKTRASASSASVSPVKSPGTAQLSAKRDAVSRFGPIGKVAQANTAMAKTLGAGGIGGKEEDAAKHASPKSTQESASPVKSPGTAELRAKRDAVSRFGVLGKMFQANAAMTKIGALGVGDIGRNEEGAAHPARPTSIPELVDNSQHAKQRGRSYKKLDLGATASAGLQDLLKKGKTVEDVFEMLDADKSGLLDEKELVQGMKAFGTDLTEEDLDELKVMLGLDRSKQLDDITLDQFRKIVEQTPAAAGGTESGRVFCFHVSPRTG